MPRLTSKHYLEQRNELRKLFDTSAFHKFGRLEEKPRKALLAFFAPWVDFTGVEEVLEHRRQVTWLEPSLPHQAGRAYKRFLKIASEKEPVVHVVPARTKRKYTVRPRGNVVAHGVRRPKLDAHKVARALVALAQIEKERLGQERLK